MIVSSVSSLVSGHRGLFRATALLVAISALTLSAFAQADNTAPGANNGGRARRGNQEEGGQRGGRGNFNPEEIQARQMAALREQFAVADDAEWNLIAARITAVNELRRNTLAANFGGFGGRGGGGGGRRGGGNANPEMDALRQAITDKLPDAEIKSRLDRVRESRKANEERLTKAQEELRAVLDVRQEAVAVMAGLLP